MEFKKQLTDKSVIEESLTSQQEKYISSFINAEVYRNNIELLKKQRDINTKNKDVEANKQLEQSINQEQVKLNAVYSNIGIIENTIILLKSFLEEYS